MSDMSNYSDPNFPMNVTETDDGFIFEWDENHPVTSVFNTWTEQDFTDAIMRGCDKVLVNYLEENSEGEIGEDCAE